MAAEIGEHGGKCPRSDEQPAHHGRCADRQVYGLLEFPLADTLPSHIGERDDEESDIESPPAKLVLGEFFAQVKTGEHHQIDRAQYQSNKSACAAIGEQRADCRRSWSKPGQDRDSVSSKMCGGCDTESDRNGNAWPER